MRYFSVLAVVVGLLGGGNSAFGGYLSGFFTDGKSVNDLKFRNYEVILRPDGSQIEINSKKYDLVTGNVPSLQTGDVLIQIYTATGLYEYNTPNQRIDFETADYALTAYAAVTVSSNSNGFVEYAAAGSADPFGRLSGNQVLQWRLQSKSAPSYTAFTMNSDTGLGLAANLAKDVDNATDGDLFASFGFGNAWDAAIGGVSVDQTRVYSFADKFNAWLNVLSPGPLFDDVSFPGYTKYDYWSQGTVPPGDRTASIVANATINLITDASNWSYVSNDPTYFRVTPEPSSAVAMLMLFVVGGIGTLFGRLRCRI